MPHAENLGMAGVGAGGEGPRPAPSADLCSGLLFAALGAAILWVGADYSLGVPSRIGPGYVPRLLGILLAAVGLFLIVRARWTTEVIDTAVAWRPLVLISVATVAFAVVFEVTGLVPAILASVAIANFATPENRWITAVVLGPVLAFFAWLLFVKGLSLPLPVWTR
jgi:putative tricarboxylic transport membrane protein